EIQNSGAADIVLERQSLRTGAFRNIEDPPVRTGSDQDRLPCVIHKGLVGGAVEPAIADTTQHRRRDHSGSGILGVSSRIINNLTPHPTFILQWSKCLHVLLERFEQATILRMIFREIRKREREAQSRKSVSAAPCRVRRSLMPV